MNKAELETLISCSFNDKTVPIDDLLDFLIIEYKWNRNYLIENYNLLQLACRYGRLEAVQKLNEVGWDTKVKTTEEYTLLHIACLYGHLEVVEWLVQSGSADVNAHNKKWETPLKLAISAGHEQVVNFLLQQNQNLSLTGYQGYYCLFEAARLNLKDIFEKLLEFDAGLECCTDILLICVGDKYDFAEKIIQKCTKMNIKLYSYSMGEVFDTIAEANDIKMLEIFKKYNIIHDCKHRTIYNECAKLEYYEFILENELCDSLDKKNFSGRTVLMDLVAEGNMEAFQLFLKYGADPFTLDSDGKNILHYAAMNWNLEFLEFIVNELKINISSRDLKGKTPLHCLKVLQKDLIKHVLNLGANINEQDDNQRTPLHWAVIDKDPIKVDALLFYGGRNDIFDKNSQRPIDLCSVFGHSEIKKIFYKYAIYRFTALEELFSCI